MAIKAGQYLLNPMIAGASVGVGAGAIMAGKHGADSVNYKEYATTGAAWGFGLGAAGLAIKGMGKFRTSMFTPPKVGLSAADKANMSTEQITALEELAKKGLVNV